jgi:hypothetical protein
MDCGVWLRREQAQTTRGWMAQMKINALLASILLAIAPVVAVPQTNAWPSSLPRPSLHYDCKNGSGKILVRVQIADYVTKDYVLDCTGI